MPAFRLNGTPRLVSTYDVLGFDGDELSFVRHVMLFDSTVEATLTFPTHDVPIAHMGPPIGHLNELQPNLPAVSTVSTARLTPTELRQMELFVKEFIPEQRASNDLRELQGEENSLLMRADYVIHPAVVRPSRDASCWRFNCCGFVMEAYRNAGIELIASGADVPLVNLEIIKSAYPDLGDVLERPAFRTRYGLSGEGGWPVVFAGYVIASIARTPEDIRRTPYAPSPNDWYFT